MIWFLFAIGIIWVMCGTFMLFSTQSMREKCYTKLRPRDPRMFSPLAIIVGVLMLLSASSSSQPTFIVILGLIALTKGLVFLFAPREKVKRVIDWWFEGTDRTQKVWGVLSLALGIAVLGTLVSTIH